jgi:hypothetical protein
MRPVIGVRASAPRSFTLIGIPIVTRAQHLTITRIEPGVRVVQLRSCWWRSGGSAVSHLRV